MFAMSRNDVDQRGAVAGGDNVGRDKNDNSRHYRYEYRRTQIEIWMEKLSDELKGDVRVQTMIDGLQYYHKKHSEDGIEGLENKLDHAGRSGQKLKAIGKKELFAKELERLSHYRSAQEIFAYFLSKVDCYFDSEVMPHIGHLSAAEIDQLVREKVVEPVLHEAGGDAFLLNYNHVLGMVYWLAEQCFIRWHK